LDRSIKVKETFRNLASKANALYKAGKKDEALAVAEQAIQRVGIGSNVARQSVEIFWRRNERIRDSQLRGDLQGPRNDEAHEQASQL